MYLTTADFLALERAALSDSPRERSSAQPQMVRLVSDEGTSGDVRAAASKLNLVPIFLVTAGPENVVDGPVV